MLVVDKLLVVSFDEKSISYATVVFLIVLYIRKKKQLYGSLGLLSICAGLPDVGFRETRQHQQTHTHTRM